MRKFIAPLIVLSLVMFASTTRAQEAPAKVAVVNPLNVFQQMQEAKDFRQQFDTQRKSLEQQQNEKRAKLKDLEDTLKQLKTDSPQYQEKNKEFVQQQIELRTWEQVEQVELDRMQKNGTRQLFDKISAAVQKIAEKKGLDIVLGQLNTALPENLDQMNFQQVLIALAQRNILYSKSNIDNEVIAQLDTDYKAAGAKK